MRHGHGAVTLPVMVLYVGLMLGAACAPPPRYYDAAYGDYHTWNQPEVGFYAQWEVETHRPHQDFGKRSAGEQKEYFTWRHNHDQDNQKKDDHGH